MPLTPARTMPGAMELLPLEQIAFQRMLDSIRRNYERFGFLPVETPVMEFAEILLTKQGGETERQVYFVQSTGALEKGGAPELALRFDLTVPLARYVAEHEHDLSFPFRRYQIQRVYRGERAQRGRFREFYQCDIDVIGKDTLSLLYDAEIPAVIYAVFRDLAIGPFTIWLNNRKIMRGFLESMGLADVEQQALALREVDKLDKRGVDHVRSALMGDGFGLSHEATGKILEFVQIRSSGHAEACRMLDELGQRLVKPSATFDAGVSELRAVLESMKTMRVPESHYAINLSIARGLDYYTGTVYETTLNEHAEIGSICSGGRYENLATNYTKSHLPGVGISIGATRLFYQLREAGLLAGERSTVQVLVTQLEESNLAQYLAIATELRNGGINTEVVMETGKLARQLKYADRSGIAFALLLGADEISNGTVTIKNLGTQQQTNVPRAELLATLHSEIARSNSSAKVSA